jgi:hypothetical protein
MYSLVITRVRLDIHLQSPVICREQPESINQKTSMPPTRKIKNESESEQTTQHWVSTKLIKPVSCHLLKSGVRKIHPISPRWNTHMSPWRTTRTMKGRPWPVAPLGPKTAIVPPHARIGHERRNVQQTHHARTQHAYHLLSMVAHLEAQTHASPEGKWCAPLKDRNGEPQRGQ